MSGEKAGHGAGKKADPVERKKKWEFSKKMIGVCLIQGFAWVWCSYILAFLGKEQIAESLSQTAVTEIIGVVLVYCAKSAVENLSKHNRWPDSDDGAPEKGEITFDEQDI